VTCSVNSNNNSSNRNARSDGARDNLPTD
jgi:hypothetical protein